LQAFLEDTLLRIAKGVREFTGEVALCYAGGVALNCSANRHLHESRIFNSVFIPPAANDAGLSIGAAYLSLVEDGRDEFQNSYSVSPYLGVGFDSQEILQAAAEYGLQSQRVSSPAKVAARLLASGEVIGWVQGRCEIGPRALGNRSLLADPRRSDIKDILNALIKKREYFRPFAPSVLSEMVGDVFERSDDSPFMLDAYLVRAEWRDRIPAVVHVDGTARLQTVTAESNLLLYLLIRDMYEKTGIPLVLNTSLNGPNEPIVASPRDALAFFTLTPLSYLLVGEYLFCKAPLPLGEFGETVSYSSTVATGC
jgi:carbamoyltransferase